MEKKKMIEQTKLAYELIQKIYHEVAYLIKEIEGQLAEADENFIIGKPSGYSINSRNSTGLEPRNVNLWPIRKMGVFFAPAELMKASGVTTTPLNSDTKVIYIRIILDNPDLIEPTLYFGYLSDFGENISLGKKLKKVEQLVSHIEYCETKIFTRTSKIDYEDNYVKFRGKLKRINLFDIENSEDVQKMIVKPALEMFRSG